MGTLGLLTARAFHLRSRLGRYRFELCDAGASAARRADGLAAHPQHVRRLAQGDGLGLVTADRAVAVNREGREGGGLFLAYNVTFTDLPSGGRA